MKITEKRASNLRALIRTTLDGKRLPTANAANLRGNLGLSASLGRGRICRGASGPLARWRYSSGGNYIIDPLKFRLEWWIGPLGAIKPRFASLRDVRVIPIHSDSMGREHIGDRWRFQRGDFISHTILPKCFMGLTYINENGIGTKIGISEFGIPPSDGDAALIASLPTHIRSCVNICIRYNIALRAIISLSGRNMIRVKVSRI